MTYLLIGSAILAALLIISRYRVHTLKREVAHQILKSSHAKSAMRAERLNHKAKIKALEARVEAFMACPEQGTVIQEQSDVRIIKSESTYDMTEPQYSKLSREYMILTSRQEILKEAAHYISTTVVEIRPDVFKYRHSMGVVIDLKP